MAAVDGSSQALRTTESPSGSRDSKRHFAIHSFENGAFEVAKAVVAEAVDLAVRSATILARPSLGMRAVAAITPR